MEEKLTRGSVDDDWWNDWWEADYSWDGLLDERKHIGGDGGLFGERSLQDYWRRDPATGLLRDVDDMRKADELIKAPDGKLWHVAHVPLWWGPASGAKAHWTVDQRAKLAHLIAQRVAAAKETSFLGNYRAEAAKQPDGTTRLRGRPETIAGQDGRAQFSGSVLLDVPVQSCEPDAHLHINAQQSWLPGWGQNRWVFGPGARFENAAFFDYADFVLATFEGIASFLNGSFFANASYGGATFSKAVCFEGAKFLNNSSFSRAKFLGGVDFSRAVFDGFVRFDSVIFSSNARFAGTIFHGFANFVGSDFAGEARFDGSKFSEADFSTATFCGYSYFEGAAFARRISFTSVTFSRHTTFNYSTFSEAVHYISAAFSETVSFFNVRFVEQADFGSALFSGHSDFRGAIFGSNADFKEARFAGAADFHNAVIVGNALFEEAHFSCGAIFRGVEFRGLALFSQSRFGADGSINQIGLGRTNFDQCVFKSRAEFPNARFAVDPAYHSAAFLGARFDDLANFRGCGDHWVAALDEAEIKGRLLIDSPDEATASAHFQGNILPRAIAGGNNPATDQPLINELEGGCRVVKVAMGKARNEAMEQRYYRFQLTARRHQAGVPRAEKLISHLFGIVSDYGLSLSRPLVGLAVCFLAFAVIYAILAVVTDATPAQAVAGPHPQPAQWFNAISMSASRLLPFGGFAEISARWFDDLRITAGPVAVLVARTLATLQSLISLVLLFLFSLAMRRRFQVGG